MNNFSKIILCLVFLLGWSAEGMAQLEEGRYEFWREDAKITYDMFQADTVGKSRYNKEYNFKSVIFTGLWGGLDVPEKKRDWKKKPEKAFFCAAMDKTESFLLEKNDMSLNHAKLLWDICELATRVARKSLANIEHQMDSLNGVHASGVISLFYSTALNDGKEFGAGLTEAFVDEVIIPNSDSMYYEYRNKIDKLLDDTKEFATTEEEIQRFTTNTPLQGYRMATQLWGDRKNRGTIKY